MGLYLLQLHIRWNNTIPPGFNGRLVQCIAPGIARYAGKADIYVFLYRIYDPGTMVVKEVDAQLAGCLVLHVVFRIHDIFQSGNGKGRQDDSGTIED